MPSEATPGSEPAQPTQISPDVLNALGITAEDLATHDKANQAEQKLLEAITNHGVSAYNFLSQESNSSKN